MSGAHTVDARTSPFYEWLDHDAIRALVHRALDLTPGERFVLVKGLIPGLVDAVGVGEVETFLDEVRTKARRYQEARTHPGEGLESREVPGERLGGPTPEGHAHIDGFRDPDRPGGPAAERAQEREAWASGHGTGPFNEGAP